MFCTSPVAISSCSSMSSVDGDSDQHSLHSRESVDGDIDVSQLAVRAPAPAQVLPKQFSDVGAPAMVFMIASSNGLWKDMKQG